MVIEKSSPASFNYYKPSTLSVLHSKSRPEWLHLVWLYSKIFHLWWNPPLNLVDNIKYLGVTLSRSLSWETIMGKLMWTTKANTTRLFLQRNLVKVYRKLKLKCYNAYVDPILEYASTQWSIVGHLALTNKMKRREASTTDKLLLVWKHSKQDATYPTKNVSWLA